MTGGRGRSGCIPEKRRGNPARCSMLSLPMMACIGESFSPGGLPLPMTHQDHGDENQARCSRHPQSCVCACEAVGRQIREGMPWQAGARQGRRSQLFCVSGRYLRPRRAGQGDQDRQAGGWLYETDGRRPQPGASPCSARVRPSGRTRPRWRARSGRQTPLMMEKVWIFHSDQRHLYHHEPN